MSMNFDTYSTSFQSLMSPMYNVSTNYNANLYGAGGMGGYGMGGHGGYMGGGFMGPMMNVGIGQFNADYLVKGDDKINNYYTRPVTVHKAKNEVPTMLGIVGAALGTLALIAALCKGRGKGVKETKKIINSSVPTYLNPKTAPYKGNSFKNSILAGIDDVNYASRPPAGTPPVPPVSTVDSKMYADYKDGVIGRRVADDLAEKFNTKPNPLLNGILNPTQNRRFVPQVKPNSYESAVNAQVAEDLAEKFNTKPNPLLNGIYPANPHLKHSPITPVAPMTPEELMSEIQNAPLDKNALKKIVFGQDKGPILPEGTIKFNTPAAENVAENIQKAVTPNLPAPIYKFDGIEKVNRAAAGEYTNVPLNNEALRQTVYGRPNSFKLPEGTVKTGNQTVQEAPQIAQTTIKGLLPQRTASQEALAARRQAALAKQEAAMNLPSTGQVYAPPIKDATKATNLGTMTPEAQQAYDRANFISNNGRLLRKAGTRKAFADFVPNFETASHRLNLQGYRFNPDMLNQLDSDAQARLYTILTDASNNQIQKMLTNKKYKTLFQTV